ncbi:MAG: phosphatase PAP2 family protein [Bradyrhizobium sp.]|nr:phosphatase PAP2 family protein [Bradyrhizobium sp.]
MADAFANPIMVDALILGREGTMVVPDTNYYAPELPGIDAPDEMDRWEPWVRAYTALGEMLQGISFETSGNAFQVLSSGSLLAEIGRPQEATFQAQMPLVLSWAELRNERATEIMAQIDSPYAFWSSIIYMHPDRTQRTFELVNIVLQFCVYVEMRFKHALACWRPVEYNAQVQPMITTPGHGSFPSGHATQVHAVAHVLKRLLMLSSTNLGHEMISEQLDRQAARIATNRVVAGVHFPIDSMAGRMLGVALGDYFVGRCTKGQTLTGRKFIAGGIDANPTTEFNPYHADQKSLSSGPFYSTSSVPKNVESPLMEYVWRKAQAEWAGKFGVPPPP